MNVYSMRPCFCSVVRNRGTNLAATIYFPSRKTQESGGNLIGWFYDVICIILISLAWFIINLVSMSRKNHSNTCVFPVATGVCASFWAKSKTFTVVRCFKNLPLQKQQVHKAIVTKKGQHTYLWSFDIINVCMYNISKIKSINLKKNRNFLTNKDLIIMAK